MVTIRKQGETSPVHKCTAHGCKGLARGALRMNIPAVDPEHPALQLPVPLLLCDNHASLLATAQDFMTTEWQQRMLVVLKNRGAIAVPDFTKAWLDVVPFDQQNGITAGPVPAKGEE